MKPMVFQYADGAWPEDVTLLHVYVLVDPVRDRAVAELASAGNAALRELPVTAVQTPWLHITIDQIADRPAAQIPPTERNALIAALTEALSTVEPFEVQVGPMISAGSGVIADLHPDEGLSQLHRIVREIIGSVRGQGAVRYPWVHQHLTIAYANGEADSGVAQELLWRVRPTHAPLQVDAVHLVDVAADNTAKTITWTELATVPLAGRAFRQTQEVNS